MNGHKVLSQEGLNVICAELKGIRGKAAEIKAAAATLDNARQLTKGEIKSLIEELNADIDALANKLIIYGTVPTGGGENGGA